MARGMLRLAAALAAAVMIAAAGWALIAASAEIGIYATGFMLLIGGYMALFGLYVAAGWIDRGFRHDARP